MAVRKMWYAASLAILGLVGCGGSVGPETRETIYGVVQGVDDAAASGTYFWKGIPFAKAPVGALRWKAPVEPDKWGMRSAKAFGNACIQNGRLYGPGANNTYDTTIGTTLNTAVGSEDCLTLNIWRPANNEKNLPVLVFIYGGSHISGYTADPMYDGTALAKAANAVIVTVNYRLGPFGFFNLPQLKSGNAQEDSGNFALLDNILALKFVQNNIATFGGNKDNVTIMGQSAGAISTWALISSPLTAGLFHKAIPLSGAISMASNLPPGTLALINPPAAYQAQSNAMLYNLLVADGTVADLAAAPAYVAGRTAAQIAEYMRSKSPATILGIALQKNLNTYGPIPDGTVLPANPIDAMAAGNYRKVPILAGNTAEEGKLFAALLATSPALGGQPGFIVSDATRFTMHHNYNGDAPSLTVNDIINPAYLPIDAPGTGWNARANVLTNIAFIAGRDNVLNTVRAQQSNVWYYNFAWKQNPAPWNDVYGAAHAYDLPFLFGNFQPSLLSNTINSTANRPGRLALSGAMMSSLAAFLRNGDPNNGALGVNWEPWPKRLIFDATLSQKNISLQ